MLVLHIGPHKTATTYLQSNFKRRRADLLKRGWLYPVIGVRTALAHHDVAEHAKDVAARSGLVFDTLNAVARDAKAKGLGVLLSAEGFRRWKPHQIRALTGVFAPRAVRVVYVLRDPMTVMRSMWAQSVKLGNVKALPAYVARHFRDPSRSRILNPLRDLEPYLELKGAAFTILLYDELERRGLDIYSAFMSEALSIEGALSVSDVANARHPLELTEFLRLMSSVGGYQSRPDLLDVGDAVRLLFSPEERDAIVETIRTHGASARRTLRVEHDASYFDGLETRLRQVLEPDFRPRLGDGRLFAPNEESWSYYDSDELMRIAKIRALVERSARRIRPGAVLLTVMNQGVRTIMVGRKLRNRLLRA